MTDQTPARRAAAKGRKPAAAASARRSSADDEWLTVDEFCAEMRITRRTFERWRQRGTAPRVKQPGGPNGPIRIKRSWFDEWLEGDAA
jgi:excisionase family DNA binding protein